MLIKNRHPQVDTEGLRNTSVKDITNNVSLQSIKGEIIKLAERQLITRANCVVILRRTGLWSN